jgi:hypothetical protein
VPSVCGLAIGPTEKRTELSWPIVYFPSALCLVRFAVISALAFVLWAYAAVSLDRGFRPAFEDLDLVFLAVVSLFWFRLPAHAISCACKGDLTTGSRTSNIKNA